MTQPSQHDSSSTHETSTEFRKRRGSIVSATSFEVRIVVIALLAVIVPLGIFVTVSMHRSSHTLTETIALDLEGKAVLVARDIDRFIDERITDARILSQADVLEGKNMSGIIQYLTEIIDAAESIDDADMIDPSGVIIASSGEQNEIGQPIWDFFPESKDLFALCREAKQGQVFVSEAQMLDTGPGVLFMTPITDDTNTVLIGILALEVNLKSIGRIVSVFDEGVIGDKYVYIVDNHGKVLVTEDPSVKIFDAFPDLQTHPELLNAFSIQGDVGNVIYTDIAGEEVMAGYADMREFGVNQALDWSIIAIAPLDEITLPARKTRNLLFVIGVITAVISMLTVYRLIAGITGALDKVAAQADLISGGDFSLRLTAEAKQGGGDRHVVDGL